MFENFQFNPGIITYNAYKLSPDDLTDIEWLTEDMFQVEYPKDYVLDVGWYGNVFEEDGVFKHDGVFVIYIIKGRDWDNPIYRLEYKTITELYEGMKKSLDLISELLITN